VLKLSPKSRKKTGRAYVALARGHSEKCETFCSQCSELNITYRGDLQVALDLYRKAESYVPDNIKLKERWIFFVIEVFLYKLTYPSI
jgi:kinesin family member 22